MLKTAYNTLSFDPLNCSMLKRIRPIEAFLIQLVTYLLMWLVNDYTAYLMSIIIGIVCFVVLVISWIVEKIEPSRVPKWYFSIMFYSVLAPLVANLIFWGSSFFF